jgi:hypothetical protein
MIIIKNDSESSWKTSVLRWIPVEQDLPDDDLAVLCADDETIWIGYRDAGKWFSVGSNEWNGSNEWPDVKYWAELPDPLDLLPY